MFVWAGVDSEVDGQFAAGLIAGDGHFAIQPNNGGTTWQCFLAVCLRADDTPLLAELCRWSGAGKLQAVPAYRTSRPQTNWIVQRQADCLRMVSILDRHPLLGKKLGQYEIWREAIVAWTGPRSDRQSVVAECSERLRGHRRSHVLASASAVSITDDHRLSWPSWPASPRPRPTSGQPRRGTHTSGSTSGGTTGSSYGPFAIDCVSGAS